MCLILALILAIAIKVIFKMISIIFSKNNHLLKYVYQEILNYNLNLKSVKLSMFFEKIVCTNWFFINEFYEPNIKVK